jgi:hypothetical protein
MVLGTIPQVSGRNGTIHLHPAGTARTFVVGTAQFDLYSIDNCAHPRLSHRGLGAVARLINRDHPHGHSEAAGHLDHRLFAGPQIGNREGKSGGEK